MTDAERPLEYPLVTGLCLVGKHNIKEVASCVSCFQDQTYPYKELVVINNAQTQLEASELNLEAQPNIFLVDTPMFLSAGIARNYGISAANGTILAQFDANYWHHPKRLEAQIATMADNEAHCCMLTKILSLSFNSKTVRELTNDRNVIAQSMVCVRPQGIDYPPVEQGEELGFLHKMNKARLKLITMEQPALMCQLLGRRHQCKVDDLELAVEGNFAEILPQILSHQDNPETSDQVIPS